MNNKVIVTGGAGFIGSHLTEHLLSEGYEVHVIDNFDPFYPREIKEQNIAAQLDHKNYFLYEKDICNEIEVRKIFEEVKPSMVVHLAAKAGVRPSIQQSREYAKVNIIGTLHMLQASADYGVKKFIFASSSSVYGLNEQVPFKEEQPLLYIASPYGATKAAGEVLCKSYSHCFKLPVIALRFFTVYGPRQRPDLAIHKFAAKLLNGEEIELYGDGLSSRDYTYVSDIVQGIDKAIHYRINGYEVFNLGNDRPIQLIDLIDRIEKTFNLQFSKKWMSNQIGDVPQTWADLTKIKKIGYVPEIELDEGLRRFASWFKKTRKG
ncbi:SDR family NAD(P)-dependent oxidoreductase [Bacillus taeanensis]|uniref:Epimerase n=1 Tax=Bacillus taeanensis TaxID=273032 RepID=A0A366XXG0_9BACI|nr:SDR family NAD(P)-dependent oxidoreductase [Bacillus taeanensis]RBW70822.1 epimerase [Bacillus taeanensis]